MKKISMYAITAFAALTVSGTIPFQSFAAPGVIVISGGNSGNCLSAFDFSASSPLNPESFGLNVSCPESFLSNCIPALSGICTSSPCTPGISAPGCSQTPGIFVPGCPQIPDTFIPDCPQIPDISVPDCPQIPDTSVPDCPQTPDTSVPGCPQVPGTSVPDLPQTPDISVPDLPQVPGTSVPDLPQTPDTSVPDTDLPSDPYVIQVLSLVNEERAREGLSALSLNTSLSGAASVRAAEIQTSFSHTRPGGKDFSTVLKESSISYRAAGENIAYGQTSAQKVMNDWMNSAGHRANILNASYTEIGIAHVKSPSGTDYWVQLFIR